MSASAPPARRGWRIVPTLGPRTRSDRARVALDSAAIATITAILMGVLGSAIALRAVFDPHGLYGITQYDDGVYFGAALRLVSGALPYRDFAFVQPPGITVLMAPFALIADVVGSRDAMALARVATALVAGLNAFLVAWLLRHRGAIASLVAGGALAVFPPAFFADHTLLLEPYAVLLALLAAAAALRGAQLATPNRALLAGLLLGLAGAVKLWAIIPALALFVAMLGGSRRHLLRYSLGVVTGFVVVCLPFVIGAPSAFFHDVFVTQAARTTTSPRQPSVRLWAIVGLHGLSLHFTWRLHRAWGVVLAAIVGGAIVLGSLVPAILGPSDRIERFALLSGIGAVALLFVPVEYFDHYSYFAAPFLALCLGCVTGRVGGLVRELRSREHSWLRFAPSTVGAVLLVLLAVGAVRVVEDETAYDRSATDQYAVNGPEVAALIPAGSCVVSDAATLTIEADRFSTSAKGCPDVVDSDGTWLAEDMSEPTGIKTASDAALVQSWRSWLGAADYVVLRAPYSFRIPWTPQLRRYFRAHFTRIGPLSVAVYRNNAPRPLG